MATQQTKVFAPEGYHFMIKKTGGFYLMRNPSSGYSNHTLTNGDKSSEYILMQYRTEHPESATDSSTGTPARTVGPTVRTTAGTVTNTSGSSSSGGGY